MLLFIHYKIKESEKNLAPIIKKPRGQKREPIRNEIKTVISLDDIDEDVENDTIRDLKKFLETPDIKAKKIVAPIISDLDLNEYFNDKDDSGEENDISDDESEEEITNNQELQNFPELSQKEPSNETPESCANELQGFNGLAAFDDFGGYQNFATL